MTIAPFATTFEQAKAHKTSPRTMERWRGDGTGPPYMRVGKKILYWPVGSAPYDEWARQRTVHSTAEADAIS